MREQSQDVERFVVDEIDSVPHLEALLLLWRSAGHRCTVTQIAKQLYVSTGQAAGILEDLQRRGLVSREGHHHDAVYFYDPQPEERNALIRAVDETYRRELIRISGIIHSKASPGIRAFANAFRFRREKS